MAYIPRHLINHDEEWRTIERFPDYLISNQARIWSTKSDQFLSTPIGKNGYRIVSFRAGKYKNYKVEVHRILAEGFIDNPDPLTLVEVNHKNGKKLDLNLTNLEWVTKAYNRKHAYTIGLNPGNGLKKEIFGINIETGESYYFESVHQAARAGLGNSTSIRYVASGKQKGHHKNILWSYNNFQECKDRC